MESRYEKSLKEDIGKFLSAIGKSPKEERETPSKETSKRCAPHYSGNDGQQFLGLIEQRSLTPLKTNTR
ncbi:hypothetical protein [Sphingobacterium lumbrici]|uniref:hypothetical protein n=1 Tax=Sphingobacterium lumbrici TaxID=2559600 RepID=UPI001129E5B1|nr:hypothetical protein [Sphingobacterium lumbrici]